MDCIINNSNQTICNWIELMKVVRRVLWCNLGTSYSNESGHSLKCLKFASPQCHSKCMRYAFILLKHHRSSHWSTRTLIWRAFGPLNGRMAGWVNGWITTLYTPRYHVIRIADDFRPAPSNAFSNAEWNATICYTWLLVSLHTFCSIASLFQDCHCEPFEPAIHCWMLTNLGTLTEQHPHGPNLHS